MAVQGFKFSDGTVVKYDYPALDNITTDKTLSIENAAADGKAVGDELTDIKEDLQTAGLSEDAKQALLSCFQNVTWTGDDWRNYYDALEEALYPTVKLSSISCVYTQSGTVYDNASLDDLKDDLVVTAHYSDSSTQTVTTYTLSGTLSAGTSTITVAYGGKTTTFSVTVTQLLPTGYTLLKWVEANGSQYINTNIPETEEFAIEYIAYRTQIHATNGGHFLSSNNYYYPFLKGSAQPLVRNVLQPSRAGGEDRIPVTSYSESENWWELNTPYKISCGWGNGDNTTYLDDEPLFTTPKGSASLSESNKLYLFTYGGNLTNTNYPYYGRFYYLKLWQNDELVHMYYPCKNASNVVGVYDVITDTFLSSNTGTALIAGEEA